MSRLCCSCMVPMLEVGRQDGRVEGLTPVMCPTTPRGEHLGRVRVRARVTGQE